LLVDRRDAIFGYAFYDNTVPVGDGNLRVGVGVKRSPAQSVAREAVDSQEKSPNDRINHLSL